MRASCGRRSKSKNFAALIERGIKAPLAASITESVFRNQLHGDFPTGMVVAMPVARPNCSVKHDRT